MESKLNDFPKNNTLKCRPAFVGKSVHCNLITPLSLIFLRRNITPNQTYINRMIKTKQNKTKSKQTNKQTNKKKENKIK